MTSFCGSAVAGECEPCAACTSSADAITKMSTLLQAGQQALKAAKQAITQLSVSLQARKQALHDAKEAMKQVPVPLPNGMSFLWLLDGVAHGFFGHIKDFCAEHGFFLLKAQSNKVHSCAVKCHLIQLAFQEDNTAAIPKAPSVPRTLGQEVHLAIDPTSTTPLTPVGKLPSGPRTPAQKARLAINSTLTSTPVGKLNDASFLSFNKSTPSSVFKAPALRDRSIAKKPVTHPCCLRVV
ncbi:hypothetical protein DXG01_005227 [Tephrocybe rancida]|nr:hypothetical protein DXG01_005227 [Tephrocybe rancida]